MRAHAVLAPPFRDFRLVGRARAALVNPAHAVVELHEAADVVGRWMIVSKLRAAGGLGHDPRGRRIIVEPTRVVDQVRQHVRHPAGGRAIGGVHVTEHAARNDLLHLAIVDTVTMLVAHDALHARRAD